jgi:hypothetical protein
MAEGRSRLEWHQTALLAALIAAGHGVRCKVSDFDPYAEGRRRLGTMADFKAAVLPQGQPDKR